MIRLAVKIEHSQFILPERFMDRGVISSVNQCSEIKP
jgi:hypothetical protein